MKRHNYLNRLLDQLRNPRSSDTSFIHHYPKFGNSLSDIFVGRGRHMSTCFYGENPLALVLKEPIEVSHSIVMFDFNGQVLDCTRIESSEFTFRHCFESNIDEDFSFIHLTSYSREIERLFGDDLKRITRCHRGYTSYQLGHSGAESVVHGNYGCVFLDGRGRLVSLARQRSRHRYVLQEVLSPRFRYEFFFSNPTARSLDIEVLGFTDKLKTFEVSSATLPPFGSWIFRPSVQFANSFYSWCTRLPIGRCVVFEFDDKHAACNVFHA